MRPLILYTIQKHWDNTFSKVNYVDTFSRMKVRCQQYADANGTFSFGDTTESASKENLLTGLAMTPPNPQWRKEREHDDEELFFSKDEDDDMVKVMTNFLKFSFSRRRNCVSPALSRCSRHWPTGNENVICIFVEIIFKIQPLTRTTAQPQFLVALLLRSHRPPAPGYPRIRR